MASAYAEEALRHSTAGVEKQLSHGRIKIDIHGHRTLLREVWGPNLVEQTQYLRVYVGHLRKKLNLDGAKDLIVTEPGIGYRLVDGE